MPKDLDKFTKEFVTLQKAGQTTIGEYESHMASRDKYQGLLLEAAREIGRVAAQLKAGGATGTKLDDFAKANEMVPSIKVSMDALAGCGKEEGRLQTVVKGANDTAGKLQKLQREIDVEVADRKKKKDRAVAAVDSKSLPAMEKLAGEVAELREHLVHEVLGVIKPANWSVRAVKAMFDKWCVEEIAKSRTQIAARDTAETDRQALDMRVVGRHSNQVKQLVAEIQTACANAEKSFKNRDTVNADKELTKAWASHAQIKKIYEPYARHMTTVNQHKRQGMQQDKDGRAILDFVANCEKAIDALAKMIKKFSRATI